MLGAHKLRDVAREGGGVEYVAGEQADNEGRDDLKRRMMREEMRKRRRREWWLDGEGEETSQMNFPRSGNIPNLRARWRRKLMWR